MTAADDLVAAAPDEAVHPELREPLEKYRHALGGGGFGAIRDIQLRRERFADYSRRAAARYTRPTDLVVRDQSVPARAGGVDVETRLYLPPSMTAARERAGWLFVHGGGMTLGSLSSSEPAAANIAINTGCPVLSVGYRLSPEVRFPGAIDDCSAALDWLFTNARDLGVDPLRLGVFGVSAGGALAAGLAERSRDGHAPPIAKQVLIYPMLDDRTSVTPSGRDAPEGTWGHRANAEAWAHYLGPYVDRSSPPLGSVPARARSLAGMPPTYLEVGELDILAPEAIRYASRLLESAVPTELHVHPGAFHAFDGIGAGTDFVTIALQQRWRAMRAT